MVTDSSSRRVIVVAGPNGSGKSSLTRRLQRPGSNLPFPEQYVNADEIAVDLRNCGDADPERTAFRLGRERRAECREAGVSFAYETVLSHPSGLVDLLLLRRAGFHVTLIVVTTADPEINVARVRGRVQVGGHAVPEEKIRQRCRRFHGLLMHDRALFDLDVSPYGNVVVRYEQGCGRIHPLATSPGSR